MLCCPNCREPLQKKERTFCCSRGHSFDIAASGYCNLLLSSRSGDRVGDDKQMVLARRAFLDRGYYQPLADVLCAHLCEWAARPVSVIDAGCGEGYYTRQMAQALQNSEKLRQMVGLDISKSATQYAAKRDHLTQYITASTYQMPIADRSADFLVSLFAPTPAKEFARVLRPDGMVMCVVPGEMHLWELKCAVYDTPYRNREEKHHLEGFDLVDRKSIEYTVTIDRPEDIRTLFAMTPYSHRTPAEGKRRLNALETLTVTLSFVLLTLRPENGIGREYEKGACG
jgi:23S rRNA (guanine745-N1)-methyltransferase